MLSSWRETTLGEVITLQRGFDLPAQDRKPGSIPIVSSSGITGRHSVAKVAGPGVVTGRYGTIGQVFYIDEDYWPLNTTLYVRDFNGNDPLFISYLLRTVDFAAHSDKSTVPGVNRNHLTRVLIPSNVAEQRAIATILSALDDKIELNRRMNSTLEEIAHALFLSWFSAFDPVRAKAEGRQPYGIDPGTAALFPASLEGSPSGNIPVGWKISCIGEVARVVGGSTPSTIEPAYWDGGTIHWATPRDLASLQSLVLLDTERCITPLGLQQISSGLLPKGTVLLSSRAPIGYMAIAEIPIAINQGFIALICDQGIPNHYVLQWVHANMEAIVAKANGTTFLEISKSNFRPIPVILPPNELVDVFAQTAESLHRHIVSNLRQVQTLADIRDTLLPRLLSGEIHVKEAERLAEQTL